MDSHYATAYTRYAYASCSKNYDDMLSRFHLILERLGQTGRRTELLYQFAHQCADAR